MPAHFSKRASCSHVGVNQTHLRPALFAELELALGDTVILDPLLAHGRGPTRQELGGEINESAECYLL